jgi:hypothetical protein
MRRVSKILALVVVGSILGIALSTGTGALARPSGAPPAGTNQVLAFGDGTDSTVTQSGIITAVLYENDYSQASKTTMTDGLGRIVWQGQGTVQEIVFHSFSRGVSYTGPLVINVPDGTSVRYVVYGLLTGS